MMQKLKVAILVLIFFCLWKSSFGQKPDGDDGTIFLGRHYSFILKGPSGWTMDGETGKSQGLQAVLYKEGSSWKVAVAVMYARVIHKDETQATVESVINNDIAEFLKLHKESQVSESPSLATRDNRRAIVRAFYDAANKSYESVAFIDEPKVVAILVLSSRDKLEYEKSLPAFKALVGSYFFVQALVNPH